MTGLAHNPLPPDELDEPESVDDYLDRVYWAKVARIKKLVEGEGMELEAALDKVLFTPPIIMLTRLREEAMKYYGKGKK